MVCLSLQKLHVSYQYPHPKTIYTDYIYHKNEKSKTCQTDLLLLKNDITTIVRSQKPVIYSRYTRFLVDDFVSESIKFKGLIFTLQDNNSAFPIFGRFFLVNGHA